MPDGSAPSDVARPTKTRRELLQVAAELFAEKGYHGTSVADIGDRIGLGRGALYHHMGSKHTLLVEISERHVLEMVDAGNRVLEMDGPPPVKLQVLSRHLMRTIADHLPEVTVFFHEVNNLVGDGRRKVFEQRERFEQIWQQIIDEGVKEGWFREGGPLATKALLGMHNYSYLWFDPNGKATPEEVADYFCDTALRGLLSPEGATRWSKLASPARGKAASSSKVKSVKR